MPALRSFLLSLLVFSTFCFAQPPSTTSVDIEVSDPTKAHIPHAQVTIAPESFPKKLETNDQGVLSVALPPGRYQISVSGQGFRTVTNDFDVQGNNKNQKFAVALSVGGCPPDPCVEVTGPSPDEQAVWKLENAYWQYVQALDLDAYRSLWHNDFLEWPFVSPTPVGKHQITDWITAYTTRGLHRVIRPSTRSKSAEWKHGRDLLLHHRALGG